jgi:hypothetical protein
MAAPARQVIIDRLTSLRRRIEEFRAASGIKAEEEEEFESWRREVNRYLGYATAHGVESQVQPFTVATEIMPRWDLLDNEFMHREWLKALSAANDTIGQVLEELSEGWTTSKAEPRPQSPHTVVNVNQSVSIQQITLGQLLEGVAKDIETKAPKDAGLLRRLLKSEVVQEYYGRTVEAVAKAVLDKAQG